jgi:hypothetical protein
MFKLMLISIVVVPVLLAMAAARLPARRGVVALLALVIAYNVFYVLMLYYLRVRWVGW